MDRSNSKSTLIVAGCLNVFAGIALLILTIARTSSVAGVFRFWLAIPFGIYGGNGVVYGFKNRHWIHEENWHVENVSESMHGILGLLLLGYYLFSGFVFQRLRHALKLQGANLGWDQDQRNHIRSRGFFWLLVLDCSFLVCVATALGLGSTYVPWLRKTCFEPEYRNDALESLGGSLAKQCLARWTIQVLGLMSCFSLGLQILQLIPIASPPRPLRALWLTGLYRITPRGPTNQKEVDIEMSTLDEPPVLLAALLQHDNIAASLAENLHYSDIKSMAQCSKSLWASTFPPNRKARLAVFYKQSCAGGSKAECWTCGIMICQGCKTQRKVYAPLTTPHLTTCHALCRSCYLLPRDHTSKDESPRRIHLSPHSAAWEPHNLKLQHPKCPLRPDMRQQPNEKVDLCVDCTEKTAANCTKERERREERDARLMAGMGARCWGCGLMDRGKRWWVCGVGNHECHWAGHEPDNQTSL